MVHRRQQRGAAALTEAVEAEARQQQAACHCRWSPRQVQPAAEQRVPRAVALEDGPPLEVRVSARPAPDAAQQIVEPQQVWAQASDPAQRRSVRLQRMQPMPALAAEEPPAVAARASPQRVRDAVQWRERVQRV